MHITAAGARPPQRLAQLVSTLTSAEHRDRFAVLFRVGDHVGGKLKARQRPPKACRPTAHPAAHPAAAAHCALGAQKLPLSSCEISGSRHCTYEWQSELQHDLRDWIETDASARHLSKVA